MRGSVWVELEVWIVNKAGGKYKGTSESVYGYSAVRDLNSNSQREMNYHFAVNKAIKSYRKTHLIGSDTEVNYHVIGSGINTVTMRDGYTSDKWHSVRISPAKKRAIHKQIFLGKDKPLTKVELQATKGQEITMTEYEGKKMKQKKLTTNNYIIETGKIHHRGRPKKVHPNPNDRIDYTITFPQKEESKESLKVIDNRTAKQKNKYKSRR